MDNLEKKRSILCWFQYHETYFNDNVIWKLWRMCLENKWRVDALANGWGHCTRWNNAYKQMKFCCLWLNQVIMFKYPLGFLQTWQKSFTFFCIKYKDILNLPLKESSWNTQLGFVQIYPEAFSRWEKLKYVHSTQLLIAGSRMFFKRSWKNWSASEEWQPHDQSIKQ